jgi:pyruvate carboxylase
MQIWADISMKTTFRKLLVANRSEIAIRVFRTASEMGIRTVAIYAHEDRYALHRFKADEAYQIGKEGEPLRSYLNIGAIVEIAKANGVDAIHPGYGFLSENPHFANAVRNAGITFIGPKTEILENLGDKVAARKIADLANVPILKGTDKPVANAAEALDRAAMIGYPVMIKASMGGGGRGMRVANNPEELREGVEQASREALTAFGVGDVFLEKLVRKARHIEVQLLGDRHGGLVHLFERDCSVQRRHQKIVEIAPAPNLKESTRNGLLESALKIGRAVGLDNAGTVEFLVDDETGEYYFIEVNPRIQVEHTVTEEVTGYDIVRTQILVASGRKLESEDIGLGDQSAIRVNGFAIQCRVTSEDPSNGFLPDYGRVTNYRSAGGMGIRLDAGSAYSGAVISPYYDSLLVKVTARGIRFEDTARRMLRTLHEFRVRGVKTNIPFLINLINYPSFLAGECTTRFIDQTPGLFDLPLRKDRATKLLRYIGNIIVNGHPEVPKALIRQGKARPVEPPVPVLENNSPGTRGWRGRLLELGADRFAREIRDHKPLLFTDTTMRDAHQSLLATRMRTHDMARIAEFYAARMDWLFSLEMWGGATFDTSMRFLKESPWDRLARLRRAIPNILFQMLLRSASAVGYTNYPDNVVHSFVKEAHQAGIDIFRCFDACNGLPNLTLAIEAVRSTGGICEASICYSGDIEDPNRTKYTLSYYVGLARELEKRGAHFLAVKDMAGLCKPTAAARLVKALRQEVGLPIHFHTHDCAGGQIASLIAASDAGVDIVDAAAASMAGNTSQPSLHALVEALRFHERGTKASTDDLQTMADYWEGVRKLYHPFESGQIAPASDIYQNEMPGGQATNLMQQATGVGLAGRWREVCKTYTEVNQLFGDIIKVTPTSKVVGDMALFLLSNNLKTTDVMDPTRELSFPESVVEFFEGRLGEPPGGFPLELQKRILRDRKPIQGRPGASMPPADFEAARKRLSGPLGGVPSDQDVVTHFLYPKVFDDLLRHEAEYSDTSVLPTLLFFQGMEPGDEASIEIEPGKTLFLRFLTIGDPRPDGSRTVFFELNGQPREVVVSDKALADKAPARAKAEPGNPLQAGSPMPGLVSRILVSPGETVQTGQPLFVLEAMKMETTVRAECAATIEAVLILAGAQVEGQDLVVRLVKSS